MPPDSIVPEDLRRWRAEKGYSLAKVAELLNVASPTTIKTWEDEKSDIPGPAELVLRWLIRGEAPFAADASGAGLGNQVREDIGAVEMTVDAFEECLRRARAVGFGSVTEWIAELVRQELSGKPEEKRRAVVYKKG
jgi:transcriptional regulator with XRE-family HTH domain